MRDMLEPSRCKHGTMLTLLLKVSEVWSTWHKVGASMVLSWCQNGRKLKLEHSWRYLGAISAQRSFRHDLQHLLTPCCHIYGITDIAQWSQLNLRLSAIYNRFLEGDSLLAIIYSSVVSIFFCLFFR